ncbi:MAG: hypothetical protein H7098_07055, partial [Oligoflexus sp.]|nr:hypothetical protein [Pseudopedobacter sp.]
MNIKTNMIPSLKKAKHLGLLFSFILFQQFSTNAQTSNKIESLISKMTLEEKVGQMTNITIGRVAIETGDKINIDQDKLRDVMINHKVGSFQNVMSHAYTLENWHEMLDNIQTMNMKESRLKIPILYAIDAVHGADYTLGSTIFPHNLGLA